MNLLIVLIGIRLACIIEPGLAQGQVQQCYTPENNIGQCLTLSYCPSIANVLNTCPGNDAEQYFLIAKQNCGNVRFRGDPVVCCGDANQQYSTGRALTINPMNPFFRTNTSPTTLPRGLPETTTSAPVPDTAQGVTNQQNKTEPPCKLSDNEFGTCKPLVQCKSLITRLLADPNNATFVRYLQFSNTLCNKEYTVVCCLDEAEKLVNDELLFPTKLPTMAEGCGKTIPRFPDNNSLRQSVVGGNESRIGSWPWIALIGYDDAIYLSRFKCGGALITSRHVLTAAHCIRSDLTFVRIGEHDLRTDIDVKHQDIPVVKALKHPQYNRIDGHNDIALLYLGKNVKYERGIIPICIPFEQKFRSKDHIGRFPVVAGWGRTLEGGKPANVLQELQITIYSNDVCKDRYKKQEKYFSEEQFDNSVICAGFLAGGKDTCQGDSGGPLMLPEEFESEVRYHLVGIVSYGIGCARPEIPGVYTRVSNYIEWIENGVATSP